METAVKATRLQLVLILALILFGVVLRIGPHPANFAPITAIALFGGTMLPRRQALLLPLLAMIVSDLIIGLHDVIPVTWGAYVLIALAGHTWLQKKSLGRVVGMALGSSVFFFLTTNAAVWLISGMYDRTLTGLLRCFALALPFFRNTLLSDFIYTGLFFSLYMLANSYIKHSESTKPAIS